MLTSLTLLSNPLRRLRQIEIELMANKKFYERMCGQEDCDRDFFLTPDQAVDYGLIDEVVKTKTSHIKIPPMSLAL